MATQAQRRHLLALMDFLYAHRAHLAYPYNDIRTAADASAWLLTEQAAEHLLEAGGSMQMDCSQCGAWMLKSVGAYHWAAPGYTGTHLELFRPVYNDPRGAEVGAITIFGPGTGHHEAMVHTPDPHDGNPLLFSHGHAGADLVTLRNLQASQTAEGFPGVRMCSIAHL